MTADVLVALLRLLVVAGLYAFLLMVVVVLARGLWPRSASRPAALDATVSPRARLLVLDAQNESLPASFDVEGDAVIGRDPTCAVHLPPMYVSARHARLSHSDGRWWIEDLGSRNKTYVEGEEAPAGRPVPVDLGDEIVVAGIRLQLMDGLSGQGRRA